MYGVIVGSFGIRALCSTFVSTNDVGRGGSGSGSKTGGTSGCGSGGGSTAGAGPLRASFAT